MKKIQIFFQQMVTTEYPHEIKRNAGLLQYTQATMLAWNSTFRKLRSWHLVPSTSWQINGETMETVTDFILGGSKITADGDCSHEIKRRLFLGWKVMTNLDSILKSRDITLPTKVCLVKTVVFPVFMYGCESWTIKKAECWRIDAFELWYWRRLFFKK